MIDQTAGIVQRLEILADRLLPLLASDVGSGLAEAVHRASHGHPRVLVLGEANRGKSSMVNALFGADLMPTGVLPLTSVPTVVTAGPKVAARVRYQDGRELPIDLDDVSDLVSERGNPSNTKRVDRIFMTAPSPYIPESTEVVDTPGTGSIYQANSEESSRARSLMDVAVMMVAADPPVSAAELALITDAMRTASRCVVVVNKADMVEADELPNIANFTRHAVKRVVDTALPVFVISLRTGQGLADLTCWLSEQLRIHGAADAARSTARAMRIRVSQLLDELAVEESLVRDSGHGAATAVADLEKILGRAHRSATSATDAVRGEALRLRHRLDQDHDRQVGQAIDRARRALDHLTVPHDTPELDAERQRTHLIGEIRDQAATWFDTIASDLRTATEIASEEAIARLQDDLIAARRAAQDVLDIQLAQATEPARLPPPHQPPLDILPGADWHELVSASIVRHLPAPVRRARQRRALREWADITVGQPFGRGRSALQSWLEESTRITERNLAAVWDMHLASLERALATVRRLEERSEVDANKTLDRLMERTAIARGALSEIDALIDAAPPLNAEMIKPSETLGDP